MSEKWRHTEAHKLDPVTVACQRLRSQAANSRPIIRLIAMAINFNLDMKEFWGVFTLLITHIVCSPCSERQDKTHVSCQRQTVVDDGDNFKPEFDSSKLHKLRHS